MDADCHRRSYANLRLHLGPIRPDPARRTALAIYESAESLRTLPNRGRTGRVRNTRELMVSGLPLLIIYRIRENSIEIDRVLHGAQKWP
ncbi:MAG: type II toxin-antitoxin system RelE/ParE family toxin [Bryobacteraceae bacterium]